MKGLTLIELIVSVAVLAIISTTVLTILVTVLRSSAKTGVIQELKQNGETSSAIMSDFIRRAKSLNSPCDGTSTSFLEIKADDDELTRFLCEGGKIASRSGVTVYLTSDKVNCSDVVFSCSKSGGYPLVEFSFDLASQHPDYKNQKNHFVGKVLLLKRSN